MKKIWLVNKGHGGMIDGKYQTYPDKMFYHEAQDEYAYEGVFNRVIGDRLIVMLKAEDRKYVDICPTEIDLPLYIRKDFVNSICRKYGKKNCVLLELHGNSSPEHNATGFEIWTGPKQTKSDVYAKVLFDIVGKDIGEFSMRSGYCPEDPDPDKEAAFYMLVKTNCAAVLPEFGFFDNWHDWKLMKDFKFREKYLLALMKLIRKVDAI